jgi:Ca-activated chloride channel family protein
MGKPEGAPIPIDGTMSFWKDKSGSVVVSKLNETMCREIATAGSGLYVRADNSNTAYKMVSRELDKLVKSDLSTQMFSEYNEQFQSFAILALILLFVEIFVFERRNKRFSKFKIFDLKDKLIKN